MRGFIITSTLFIILIIAIIINYYYVNTIHDTMHKLVRNIEPSKFDDNTIIINSIYDYWESKNKLLSISVSFREIDALSNDLASLYAANQLEDEVQIAIYKERLQNSIDAIMRLERFSIKNIL